jgi:penicillin-binding protein 1C
VVYDSNGKLLRLTLSPDNRYRLWVPLTKMEQKIIDATLLYEDRHFYWHPVFNPADYVPVISV